MKSSKSRMETDQCKLGSIQKYLEEYHYPHRNDHVINTATVKPQKNWIILWSSLNLRYSLKISPMFNLKWNLIILPKNELIALTIFNVLFFGMIVPLLGSNQFGFKGKIDC